VRLVRVETDEKVGVGEVDSGAVPLEEYKANLLALVKSVLGPQEGEQVH
jgi:hypothetical protein